MGIDITSGAGACLEDFGFTDALIGSGPPSLSQIIMVCSGIPVLFRIFPPFSLPSYGVLLKFTCHYSLSFSFLLCSNINFSFLVFSPNIHPSLCIYIHMYMYIMFTVQPVLYCIIIVLAILCDCCALDYSSFQVFWDLFSAED